MATLRSCIRPLLLWVPQADRAHGVPTFRSEESGETSIRATAPRPPSSCPTPTRRPAGVHKLVTRRQGAVAAAEPLRRLPVGPSVLCRALRAFAESRGCRRLSVDPSTVADALRSLSTPDLILDDRGALRPLQGARELQLVAAVAAG
jgi:hypothetical protein